MTAHDPTPAADPEPARTRDLAAMQRALEEGLRAIAAARTAAEAEAARDRARARLESLGFRTARVADPDRGRAAAAATRRDRRP